jgi:hypothetical protein
VASRRDERLDPGELGAQLGGERLGIPSLDQRAREALEDGDATRVRDVAGRPDERFPTSEYDLRL